MKFLLCRLAQRRINPDPPSSGILAKHVNSCPDCQNFFTETRSLEHRLRSAPRESDEAMCRNIMEQVRAVSIQESPKPAPDRSWMAGAGLATAAAIVLGVMTILQSDHSGEDHSTAQSPTPSGPVKPTVDSTGDPAPSLASLVEQRELLERDARKLGAHLRERVILFQSVN